MNEFSLDTIDDIISDTIKLEREIDIRGIDKQYVNNSATKKLAYLQVAKEFAELMREQIEPVFPVSWKALEER